jgi:hypothetical protein
VELHHVTFSYVCGMLDGIERYAYWKDGVQYVGTTGTLLSDAKDELFRSLGLPVEDLRRVEKTRFEMGASLRARCRKLGRGAMVAGVDPLDKVVQPSDQASGLRRLKEEATGGGSKPDSREDEERFKREYLGTFYNVPVTGRTKCDRDPSGSNQ